MTILTVVGARPQFVKAAPVSRALAQAGLGEILLHTGQHYDPNMSGVFFEELGLRAPDIQLGVGSGSHAEQTAAMLVGIEAALLKSRPDWLLIYGDTNSTLAGALAASKLGVPVAHVEAGLRSFNMRMPEEINRIVADRLSSVLFTPTATSCANLAREGVPAERVRLVGDVMFDAVLLFRQQHAQPAPALQALQVAPKTYVLATIHRAENTDAPERLGAILQGLGLLAQRLPVIAPLHPRTKKFLSLMGFKPPANLHFIEPVGFLEMQQLERDALVIATDSGGVQKEAFWHGVPCVTLRDETEWVELIEAGVNRLCPPVSAAQICATVLEARTCSLSAPPLYGDGTAARQIAQFFLSSSAAVQSRP